MTQVLAGYTATGSDILYDQKTKMRIILWSEHVLNLHLVVLSVIVRENRAGAKDRGRPFTFIFTQYKSYLKRLGMVAFAEVDVRFSSRNHHSIILGPPAAKNNRDFGQLCVTVKHTSYDS